MIQSSCNLLSLLLLISEVVPARGGGGDLYLVLPQVLGYLCLHLGGIKDDREGASSYIGYSFGSPLKFFFFAQKAGINSGKSARVV